MSEIMAISLIGVISLIAFFILWIFAPKKRKKKNE